MNSNQKKLKQMIRDQELTISDEELFTSSAYQKYLTSMAKAATGRYRQGLQALMEWDARADAGIAHTDNYKIHINAANEITQSFPSRYLRSESLVGFNGHETAHLLFSDFTALGLYLGSMEKGAFYPSNPSFTELSYQTNCEEILEAMDSKDKVRIVQPQAVHKVKIRTKWRKGIRRTADKYSKKVIPAKFGSPLGKTGKFTVKHKDKGA